MATKLKPAQPSTSELEAAAAKLSPFEAFNEWKKASAEMNAAKKRADVLKERLESEFSSKQRQLVGKLGKVGYRILRTLKQRAGYEVKACEYWSYEMHPVTD